MKRIVRGWISKITTRYKEKSLSIELRRADQWIMKSLLLLNALDERRIELEGLLEGLHSLARKLDTDLKRAESLELAHQTVIEQLRSKLQIVEETIVPAQIAAHRQLVELLNAEIVAHVRKQAAATPSQEER